ncbi:MAG: Rrf2 family transcriptional regulator [Chthonomonadales bacterium]|nr:Rrf2 family transcriptional regulator [Chthonomonadales bacterium]
MLNQSVGYAITALGYLANDMGRPVPVREISKATRVPAYYLAKIIHTLARRGLVTTQRGTGGGVLLAQDPKQLTLYDICVALDDPVVKRRCLLELADCSDERACPAHGFWSFHRQQFVEFLRRTTLQEMADLLAR